MIKRIITIFYITILAFVVLCFMPGWINDISCRIYRNEVESSLADESYINVLQLLHECGNSSGTGNHTDLYVVALVETDIQREKLEDKVPGVREVFDADKNNYITPAMKIMNLKFNKESAGDGRNCYILEFSRPSPCYAFDISGH